MVLAARRLSEADLAGCLALSAEAGWNQTAADWRAVFASGEVRGLEREGRLIASAAVLPWPAGPFGWVCMVLVSAAERRQGHATRLLDWAVARLEAMGRTAGLDATPAGRAVYLRRGFADVYALTRLRAEAPGRLPLPAGAPLPRPMTAADLGPVAAFDAPVFGADRSGLLTALRARQPGLAFVAGEAGAPAGFVLGREGRTATQIGPVIARDEAVATALIAAALAGCAGPVLLDLPDRHEGLGRALAGAGFVAERPFIRMLAGRAEPLDRPGQVFAVTGPEFG